LTRLDNHHHHSHTTSFTLITPPPPTSTLFPYTTLFRSCDHPSNPQPKEPEQPAPHIPKQSSPMCGSSKGTTRGRVCEPPSDGRRSEEHTSELQSLAYLVCRLLLEKKKNKNTYYICFRSI